MIEIGNAACHRRLSAQPSAESTPPRSVRRPVPPDRSFGRPHAASARRAPGGVVAGRGPTEPAHLSTDASRRMAAPGCASTRSRDLVEEILVGLDQGAFALAVLGSGTDRASCCAGAPRAGEHAQHAAASTPRTRSSAELPRPSRASGSTGGARWTRTRSTLPVRPRTLARRARRSGRRCTGARPRTRPSP